MAADRRELAKELRDLARSLGGRPGPVVTQTERSRILRAADLIDPPDCKHERWMIIGAEKNPQGLWWLPITWKIPDDKVFCADCGRPAAEIDQGVLHS